MREAKLLGPLESDVMNVMWQVEEATVRDVVDVLQRGRPIAYTTVMTIMGNLTTKGLLVRRLKGKAHMYRAAYSREAFWEQASRIAVSDVLARFGDLAIARFIESVNELAPEDLALLRQLAEKTDQTQEQEGEV